MGGGPLQMSGAGMPIDASSMQLGAMQMTGGGMPVDGQPVQMTGMMQMGADGSGMQMAGLPHGQVAAGHQMQMASSMSIDGAGSLQMGGGAVQMSGQQGSLGGGLFLS